MGPPQQQRSFVFACIAAWIANSAICVLTNKHILFYLKFSFPTTLAVLHMASAYAATSALIYLTPDGRRHLPPKGTPPSFYYQLAGIAALFGIVLVLANSAFMYLSVPSIQMLKAVGAATTFVVGLAFGTEVYTHRSALKVLVVASGVVIASYGDVRANLLGVLLQVSAIVADAVRCNLLQLVMQNSDVKLTPVGTLYHVAPMAAVTLSIPAILMEFTKLRNHTAPIPYTWLLFSCIAASSLNLVVFTLIGKTSALTTSVTGPLKEWVCILTAMMVYGTPVTVQQWIGYAIALSGIFWYQRDKFFSAAQQQQLSAAAVVSGSDRSSDPGVLVINWGKPNGDKLPVAQRDVVSAAAAASEPKADIKRRQLGAGVM